MNLRKFYDLICSGFAAAALIGPGTPSGALFMYYFGGMNNE